MRKTFVYFIQAGGTKGPIKIGVSDDPRTRLKGMQTSHHEKLTLLGIVEGTQEDEETMQDEVCNSRIRGEWFRPTEEVLALVRKAVPAPRGANPLVAPEGRVVEQRKIVEDALAFTDNNVSKAAKALGVCRRTLQNRMRLFGIAEGRSGRKFKALKPVYIEEDSND
jgi:transcriptional regulator of acetoin/glycerol metabolism